MIYFQILMWPNFCPQILKKGVSESLSVPRVAEITCRTISITLSTNSCLALEAALFSPTRLVAVTQLMAPSLQSWPCSMGTCLCQILAWNGQRRKRCLRITLNLTLWKLNIPWCEGRALPPPRSVGFVGS